MSQKSSLRETIEKFFEVNENKNIHLKTCRMQLTQFLQRNFIILNARIKKEELQLITLSFHLGEGNGTPFQYSCLENPMDRGA